MKCNCFIVFFEHDSIGQEDICNDSTLIYFARVRCFLQKSVPKTLVALWINTLRNDNHGKGAPAGASASRRTRPTSAIPRIQYSTLTKLRLTRPDGSLDSSYHPPHGLKVSRTPPPPHSTLKGPEQWGLSNAWRWTRLDWFLAYVMFANGAGRWTGWGGEVGWHEDCCIFTSNVITPTTTGGFLSIKNRQVEDKYEAGCKIRANTTGCFERWYEEIVDGACRKCHHWRQLAGARWSEWTVGVAEKCGAVKMAIKNCVWRCVRGWLFH